MDSNLKNIIGDATQGNREAQSYIYNRYSEKLYPICIRYSPNLDEAQDNLQDTFITIFEKLSTYRGDGSFEGWIKRITVTTCLGKYKKKREININEEREIKDEDSYDELEQIPDMPQEAILNMIQELPAQYRLVFNLYVLDSYSHAKISNELSISEGTSKSNLSRAKKILQKRIISYRKMSETL